MLDEAHATGVCGPQGRGIAAAAAASATFSPSCIPAEKLSPAAGAFVCGSATLKDYLVNRARTFIFSTAMPPYIAGQIRAALAIARGADARARSPRANLLALREELAARGFDCGASTTHIVPVMLGSKRDGLARRERTATRRIWREGDPPADGSRRHGAHSPFADQPDHRSTKFIAWLRRWTRPANSAHRASSINAVHA